MADLGTGGQWLLTPRGLGKTCPQVWLRGPLSGETKNLLPRKICQLEKLNNEEAMFLSEPLGSIFIALGMSTWPDCLGG